MERSARFRVDPRLAKLLGDTYRSSEHALKELVDNSWDADAARVEIRLPSPPSLEPIVITDDGTGMTPKEVEQEYLLVARDRVSRKGSTTPNRRRRVKGRKGIGKFAGLMVAQLMRVETVARGTRTSLVIKKEEILAAPDDREEIPLPLAVTDAPEAPAGTTIILSSLNQAFVYPSEARLRALLMQEYGREEAFQIIINGAPIGLEDVPGEVLVHEENLPDVGEVTLRYSLAVQPHPRKASGISIRVDGKIVGGLTFFGLDKDEDIPPKLLARVYGELVVDALSPDVTADWGGIVENSRCWKLASEWAADRLKQDLSRVFAREVEVARRQRDRDIQRRLEALPEHRRAAAERVLKRVFAKFYGDTSERIDVVVDVALDAFEHDDYWAVIKNVEETAHRDISLLAEALEQFGLVDMAVMAYQAQSRLAVIEDLERLVADPSTLEADVHKVFERNLWILGSQYSLMSSNATLTRVIREHSEKRKWKGSEGSKRPDLFLSVDLSRRYLLIEFKRPSHTIDRDDEAQAQKYRDELATEFSPIDIIVIGKRRGLGVQEIYDAHRLQVLSYSDVLSRAQRELQWLLDELKHHRI